MSQYVSASDGSAVGLPSKSKVEMEAVSKPPTSRLGLNLSSEVAESVGPSETKYV